MVNAKECVNKINRNSYKFQNTQDKLDNTNLPTKIILWIDKYWALDLKICK